MAQTSSDEGHAVPNLALHSIIRPALASLASVGTSKDLKASTQQLIQAFNKAEDAIPGISQEILAGILRADGYSMNINEILLRCSHADTDDFQIEREEPEFVILEKKANELKAILGKIPEEIQDRSKFLQTIKDIASAIKDLLDSVNQVLKTYQDQGRIKEYRKTLEQNKREFVKYSKSFSDTLKQYFKDLNFTRTSNDDILISSNQTKQRLSECKLSYQPNEQYSNRVPNGWSGLTKVFVTTPRMKSGHFWDVCDAVPLRRRQ